MLDLSISRISFPHARPLSISFHTWDLRQSYLVFLRYKDLNGLAEANPFKPITGDSSKEFLQDAARIPQIPLTPERNTLAELHRFLNEHTSSKTLQSAIDAAYHDLAGKIRQVPVYRLYSLSPQYVPNSVTVFLQNSMEETQEEARAIYRQFPHLSILKIKLKGEEDIERVLAIKAVSPERMKFTLDANQGFKDPKEAVKTLREISRILGDVLLVEEPCPKGELEKMRFVRENLSGMMVFADESAPTLDTVKKISQEKAAHGINIKLQKAGGIWPAKEIATFCQKEGLKIMVGAMIEGPIAIATGVHFAVSTENIIFSDLDTDLDIAPFCLGQPAFERGERILGNGVGLGISLDMAAIEQQKQSRDLVWEDCLQVGSYLFHG
jgi:L-alanine-DL-glutamate epimerase-like enolase superfamily enzyme